MVHINVRDSLDPFQNQSASILPHLTPQEPICMFHFNIKILVSDFSPEKFQRKNGKIREFLKNFFK